MRGVLRSSVLSLFLPLPHHYTRHAAYDADGGAGEDLAKGVALQKHATAHDGSREEDGNGEPPNGVESKNMAVGQEGADDYPCASRVHADSVPHVGYHASALHKQAHHQYGAHEGGQVEISKHVHA